MVKGRCAQCGIFVVHEEIDRLMSFVERRLHESRTAIGNLSHAVKTPLAGLLRLAEDPRLAATDREARGFERAVLASSVMGGAPLALDRTPEGLAASAMFSPDNRIAAV